MKYQLEIYFLGARCIYVKQFNTLDEAKAEIKIEQEKRQSNGSYSYEIYDIDKKIEIYYEIL